MAEYQSQTERTYESKPPIPEELLIKIYKQWRLNHSTRIIPPQYLEAAHWWINHQEPQTTMEQPMTGTDSKGNRYWVTPYISRLVETWRTFLNLPENHKELVIDKIESGIPWRGDDMKMFSRICAETDKMNLNKDAYKEAAFEQLRKMGVL